MKHKQIHILILLFFLFTNKLYSFEEKNIEPFKHWYFIYQLFNQFEQKQIDTDSLNDTLFDYFNTLSDEEIFALHPFLSEKNFNGIGLINSERNKIIEEYISLIKKILKKRVFSLQYIILTTTELESSLINSDFISIYHSAIKLKTFLSENTGLKQ